MRRIIAAFLVLFAFALPASAIDIQEIVSPKGVRAWLVENHSIPLIAMAFSFEPGASADPAGKEGLAYFLSAMIDEGAGDLDSEAFMVKRDALGMKMSFEAGRDEFAGSFQTLSKNRDAAFAHLTLALASPRFDAAPVARIRSQLLVGVQQNLEDPERIASNAWMKTVFKGHAYGRDSEGSAASINSITADDLRALHKRLFSRQGLTVAVVGDIDAEALKRALDGAFGGLPDTPVVAAGVPPPAPEGPSLSVISRDIPQSIIMFGAKGIRRSDPDFVPAYVASHILGGGGFGSRLTDEVRVKRGLTYGIGYGLAPLDQAGLVLGSVGTRNEKAGEVLAVVKETLKTYADEGPTAKELDEAKTFLTGSYALRFDSNTKIASQLLGLQQENLGIDYVNKRNGLIEAVTLGQAKSQAKRLLDSANLTVVIVGKPEGIPAGGG
jgi:zinc protease